MESEPEKDAENKDPRGTLKRRCLERQAVVKISKVKPTQVPKPSSSRIPKPSSSRVPKPSSSRVPKPSSSRVSMPSSSRASKQLKPNQVLILQMVVHSGGNRGKKLKKDISQFGKQKNGANDNSVGAAVGRVKDRKRRKKRKTVRSNIGRSQSSENVSKSTVNDSRKEAVETGPMTRRKSEKRRLENEQLFKMKPVVLLKRWKPAEIQREILKIKKKGSGTSKVTRASAPLSASHNVFGQVPSQTSSQFLTPSSFPMARRVSPVSAPFSSKYALFGQNPLPSQKVTFHVANKSFLDAFVKHGHSITHLDIKGNFCNEYNLFRRLAVYVLPHVKNLKTLKILCSFSKNSSWVDGGHGFWWSPATVSYCVNLLPDLPQLEHLEIAVSSYLVHLHRIFLVKYGSQLKSVTASQLRWPPGSQSVNTVNLKSLLVDGGWNPVFKNLQHIRCHTPLPVLEKLELKGKGISCQTKIKEVISLLGHFPTLTTLKLTFFMEKTNYLAMRLTSSLLSANLKAPPSLKTLTVIGHWEGLDYTWLLSFPLIEKLSITEVPTIAKNPEFNKFQPPEKVEIQKYLGMHQMYKSNVWKKLKNLQEIKYQHDDSKKMDIYHRSNWMKLMEQKKKKKA